MKYVARFRIRRGRWTLLGTFPAREEANEALQAYRERWRLRSLDTWIQEVADAEA